MPIAIAAVSIYEGIAAWTAATTVLTTVAAGAMIAGGAVTAVGVATGNKQLQQDGMMVAAAGGLGTMAAGVDDPTAPPVNQGAASGAADNAGGGTYMGQGNADTVFTNPGTPATLSVGGPPAPPPPPTPPPTPADPNGIAARLDALKSSQEAMQKYSIVSGVLQGAGTAYSGWAQQQAQKELAAQQQQFQQGLANRANTVGSVANMQPAGLLSVGGIGTNAPVATPTISAPVATPTINAQVATPTINAPSALNV